MRNRLNLSRLSNGLVRLLAALRVNQMRGKDRVNECRLSETSLACSRDSARSLETKIFLLKGRQCLPTTITLNWKPRFKSLCSICCVMVSKPTYAVARTSSASTEAMASVEDEWDGEGGREKEGVAEERAADDGTRLTKLQRN